MKTYKFKLKPNKTQEKTFEKWVDTTRYLYNLALEERIIAYQSVKKSISKFDQYNQLPDIKQHFPWVADVYSDTLQEVLDRVDKSFKNFFRGNGFPKWAKKGFYSSFTFKRNFTIKEKTIKLPKIGEVKYFNSRSIKGNPKIATIKKEADGWYICVVVEYTPEPKTTNDNQVVGVDLGIVQFATLSNGEVIANPKFLSKSLPKLKVLQRKLSRQVKGSNERTKTKKKLAKLHKKISNQRKDFLHKVSTDLVTKYSTIVIEDLNVSKMNSSVSSRLNRSISDVGFYNFRLFLQYKSKERCQELIIVNPAYTSQTCSSCGNIDKKSRKTQSKFKCVSCGFEINADLNASINILSRGTTQVTQSKPLG